MLERGESTSVRFANVANVDAVLMLAITVWTSILYAQICTHTSAFDRIHLGLAPRLWQRHGALLSAPTRRGHTLCGR